MNDEKIRKFIEESRRDGFTDEEIRAVLREKNISEKRIEGLLNPEKGRSAQSGSRPNNQMRRNDRSPARQPSNNGENPEDKPSRFGRFTDIDFIRRYTWLVFYTTVLGLYTIISQFSVTAFNKIFARPSPVFIAYDNVFRPFLLIFLGINGLIALVYLYRRRWRSFGSLAVLNFAFIGLLIFVWDHPLGLLIDHPVRSMKTISIALNGAVLALGVLTASNFWNKYSYRSLVIPGIFLLTIGSLAGFNAYKVNRATQHLNELKSANNLEPSSNYEKKLASTVTVLPPLWRTKVFFTAHDHQVYEDYSPGIFSFKEGSRLCGSRLTVKDVPEADVFLYWKETAMAGKSNPGLEAITDLELERLKQTASILERDYASELGRPNCEAYNLTVVSATCDPKMELTIRKDSETRLDMFVKRQTWASREEWNKYDFKRNSLAKVVRFERGTYTKNVSFEDKLKPVTYELFLGTQIYDFHSYCEGGETELKLKAPAAELVRGK